MAVEAFLEEAPSHLQRSDIVLCRGSSLFSLMIRWFTRSDYSHAALVFALPQPSDGFQNTFLIEAVPTGTEITDIRHYIIDHKGKYDLVIKRFDRDWFTAIPQKLVRGHMLDFIKADYDFRTIWRIAIQILRTLILGARTVRHGFRRAVTDMANNGQHIPTHFICSGFVQYGFFAAARSLEKNGKLRPEQIDDVLFSPLMEGNAPTVQDLIATTPADLANSEKLRFLYVIRNGLVHRVATQSDVERILKQGKMA